MSLSQEFILISECDATIVIITAAVHTHTEYAIHVHTHQTYMYYKQDECFFVSFNIDQHEYELMTCWWMEYDRHVQ